MKPFAIASLALLAEVVAGATTHAATYHYTDHWEYIGQPALAAAEFDARLQADAAICDTMVVAQDGAPTPGYRSCMRQHGSKFLSVTRLRVPRPPSDPNFSSNAKLRPGHFIDRDTGMDCEKHRRGLGLRSAQWHGSLPRPGAGSELRAPRAHLGLLEHVSP